MIFMFCLIIVIETRKFFPNIDQKSSKKEITGLRPALLPYGPAPPPPIMVGAKCLAAVVLDNQDHALRHAYEWCTVVR